MKLKPINLGKIVSDQPQGKISKELKKSRQDLDKMVKYGTSTQLGILVENHKEKFPADWKYAENARSKYVDNMMSQQYEKNRTSYNYQTLDNGEYSKGYQLIQKWEPKIIKGPSKKGKGPQTKLYKKHHIVNVNGLFENILDIEIDFSKLVE